MNDLIRKDTVFGKRVNIVGDISADLVLESLGKIYIKSRNKSLTLEEIIKSLVFTDPNVSTSRVKVVETIDDLDTSEFKEGTFVFAKDTNILYLFIDEDLLELINVAPEGTGYVKRSGDTMSGKLSIYVKDGPPLYVNSSDLVKNLNAEYLGGESSKSFTRRAKDERITGKWTFASPTKFEDYVLFYKDIILNGSIGSPSFSSGFGGFGWRMDADTNTLTVDNLIVRKLMHVYELVVNKISATNGSLWVTNAGKVKNALKLQIKPVEFFTASDEYSRFTAGLKTRKAFIKCFKSKSDSDYLASFGEEPWKAFSNASGLTILVKECLSKNTLKSMSLIITSNTANYTNEYFDGLNTANYHFIPLFDSDFKFNCTFPIITREDYQQYQTDVANETLKPIKSYISYIQSYYKYFANGDFYLVTFDSDYLPVFKPGDIVRCQKWTYDGIKYYDAVVCSCIGDLCVLLLALSLFDKKTTITYDDSLKPTIVQEDDKVNMDLYESSNRTLIKSTTTENEYDEILVGLIEKDDSIVLIGNLWNSLRLNAVYITSTDNGAPFMDVLSGLNRPDYSVIYYTPVFKTVKLYATPTLENPFTGYDIELVPYTGDYYILNSESHEYVYFKYNNLYYISKRPSVPVINGVTIEPIYYLNTYPDENTYIGDSVEEYYILTESNEKIEISLNVDETDTPFALATEEDRRLLLIASTRTTKARFGNLDGILDEIFPLDKLPYGYGLYGLNVYLIGEFYLNNGRSLAEISKDSLTFALGVEDAMNQNINFLLEELLKAVNLLKKSVYTKGDLKSAGMYIGLDGQGKPGIVMWGNKIIMATTEDEFTGKDSPTALFADGKIQAKFLSINEVHNLTEFYSDDNPPKEVKYVEDNTEFEGENNVYFYRYVGTDGEGNQTISDDVDYIRKFTGGGGSFWAKCDIYGEFTGSPEYVEFKGYLWNTDSLGAVTNGKLRWEGYTQEQQEDYEGDDSEIEMYFIHKEFLTYINAVRLWSLHSDGKGNLGGNSVFWDTEGKLTVTGKIQANNGYIGGLYFNSSNMFAEKPYIENSQTHAKTYSNYYPISFITTSVISSSNMLYGTASTVLLKMFQEMLNGGLFLIKQRMILEPSGIMFDDAYALNTGGHPYGFSNRTTVSYDGITMRQNGMDMGVSCVLLNLILIPVYEPDRNVYGLYVRGSASTLADFNSMTAQAFNQIDVYWHSLGRFVISFPGMNDDNEFGSNFTGLSISRWFAENLLNGNIHIQVQGTNIGRLPAGLSVDALNSSGNYYINQDDFELDLGFDCHKINASLDSIVFSSNSTCKFGTSHYFIKGVTYNSENEDTSYYLYYFPVESFRLYGMYNYVDEEHTSYNMSDSKTLNYLSVSTSDLDGLKDGGILLLIIYNNFTNNNIGGTTYVANS